jgi:bacterioferritin
MQRNDGGQSSAKPFLTDVKVLRERARKQMELGAVTDTYGGDVQRTIEILQSVLATELVCVLRYTQHSIVATGLASESVAAEFAEHAREEQDHAMRVAERINQLGGAPDFSPDTLTARSASQYETSDDLVALIRENLVAERIAVDHYRELIRYFGDDDPATRTLLESILAVEEEHASDMVDLLAIHGGQEQVAGVRHAPGAPPTQPGQTH